MKPNGFIFASVDILWVGGEASSRGVRIQKLLKRLEDDGRANQADDNVDDWGKSRQSGVLTFTVAAFTPEEWDEMTDIPNVDGEPEDVEISQIDFEQEAGEHVYWNPAIYNCGRACELPAFKEVEAD